MTKQFVHLHVHSQFSTLDGQASIKSLLKKAQADGMPGIALTDHGVMYGIKEFYNQVSKINAPTLSALKTAEQALKQAQESGTEEISLSPLMAEVDALRKKIFKPIIGCEVYCARRSRHDKDPSIPDPYSTKQRSIDASGWHLVLLAKNLQGYKNLIKLVSYGWTEGYYHKPRIDKELLERYHEGLIVCSACLGGEVPQLILSGHADKAEESVLWFKRVFGDDYYLELQRHKAHDPKGNQETYEQQTEVNAVLQQLAVKCGVKLVATNDVHFVNEDDADAHEHLICLSTGKKIDEPRKMAYSREEWFKTTEEMHQIFSDIPEALASTLEICDKVELYSIDNPPLMPNFPIPEGFADADEYLHHLTYQGAMERYGEAGLTDTVRERIDFELATIKGMGYPGYFLIVQDFIRAAREMGVLVGPGRGSAAGSAVAYCLKIVDLDPIKYDLLFERFLNPDRISMPDIDVDFDDDGRALILKWVENKYGADHVAHIITYGTMAAKSSIKDVARVQGLPLADSNRLAKLIPDKIGDNKKPSIKDAIEHVTELKGFSIKGTDQMRNTLKYAQQLEGSIRNTGVHACGIIIGQSPISDIVPVSTATDSSTQETILVTQYEGGVIEETGLIKMDFLGLKTLSIIKETLDNIKANKGIDIDINSIPLDDANTYRLYSEGRTVGTFQFESAGMQRYLKELKPTKFEDLIAMNALYRPGPMDSIPEFVARKHGRSPITYVLDCMEPYLNNTYGIAIYQEQIMLLSRVIAGFTRGQSDELRKAMGKKLIDKMEKLKALFIEGGTKNGHDPKVLDDIWAEWAEFAKYAFNKSHAACYSWVAYQTGYLKANYPSEYMAGNLSRNLSNSEEISKLMRECQSMKIKVLVPDVNESGYKFSVNKDGHIRFGLNAIKGVSGAAVEHIISERQENGPYKDVYDFFERISMSICNRKTLESLVYAGGLDSLGIERETYFIELPQPSRADNVLKSLIDYGTQFQMEQANQGSSLFGDDDESMQIPRPTIPTPTEEVSQIARLVTEKEYVGIYLSGNPMDAYRFISEKYCNVEVKQLNELDTLPEGKPLRFIAFVSKVSEGRTKKNEPFGKILLEDLSGSYELTLFSKKYAELGLYFAQSNCLMIHANIQSFRFDPSRLELDIVKVDLLDDVVQNLVQGIELSIPTSSIDQPLVEALDEYCKNNKGNSLLSIKIVDEELKSVLTFISDNKRIHPTGELLDLCEEYDLAVSISQGH